MLDHAFTLKPSKVYIVCLSVILLFTLAILFLYSVAWWLTLAGCLVFFIYSSHLLWKFALLRSKHAILGFKRLSHDRYRIYTRSKAYEARLCGSSLVTRLISVLRFQPAKSCWLKPSCIILPDSLAPGLYRRLLHVIRVEEE